MLSVILKLFTNKKVASILGVLVAVVGLYGTYSTTKDSWYKQGVKDTEIKYQAELIKERTKATEKLNTELAKLRTELNAGFAAELERIKADTNTEVIVNEVIKYVEKEIPIPVECDSVPPEFIRMYNNLISRSDDSSK